MYQCYGLPRIKHAMPFYVGHYRRRNNTTRMYWSLMVMGIRPEDQVFDIPNIEKLRTLLKKTKTILLDRLCLEHFGAYRINKEIELEKFLFTVVGDYSLGGILRDGTAVVSDQNYNLIARSQKLENVNLILIQLEDGADPAVAREHLRKILPADVRLLTRSELEEIEKNFWLKDTSAGTVIGFAVILAFIIGIIILYQVFSAEIHEHLAEYATLKAIGYSNYAMALIVIQQSLLLVSISFVLGTLLAITAYEAIDIKMTLSCLVLVFFITIFMALTATIISLRTVILADPADVF